MEIGFNLKENLFQTLKSYRDVDPNYILRILRSNMSVFWSWGTHALTNLNGKGLRMTVSGFRHKGHVYILLNGADLFDVILTTNRGTVKQVFTDIYFDQLLELVDDAVEYTGADYEAKVTKWLNATPV